MSIKEMPHVTVEQVLRLRDMAVHIERQRDALITFANEALEACFHGHDWHGGDIQERGHELGLLDHVPYDPEKHTIEGDAEIGEMIYVRKSWLGTKD